jgi:hypothetical protein
MTLGPSELKLLGFLGKSVRYCGNELSPADEMSKLLGLLAKSVRFCFARLWPPISGFGLQLPVAASNFRLRPPTSVTALSPLFK